MSLAFISFRNGTSNKKLCALSYLAEWSEPNRFSFFCTLTICSELTLFVPTSYRLTASLFSGRKSFLMPLVLHMLMQDIARAYKSAHTSLSDFWQHYTYLHSTCQKYWHFRIPQNSTKRTGMTKHERGRPLENGGSPSPKSTAFLQDNTDRESQRYFAKMICKL